MQLEFDTEFVGYDRLEETGTVVAIVSGDELADGLNEGESGAVILDRTPFYAESGGQVGDTGILRLTRGGRFRVTDTQKSGSAFLHLGTVELGQVRVGDELPAEVDAAARGATVLNHSATHLLHAALRDVLGSHVTQKGSLVAPDRLRFDFSHRRRR